MARQTAVEWIEDELSKLTTEVLYMKITSEQHHKKRIALWEKAKEMEKEQTLDFASNVLTRAECSWTGIVHLNQTLEDIYNEINNKDGK